MLSMKMKVWVEKKKMETVVWLTCCIELVVNGRREIERLSEDDQSLAKTGPDGCVYILLYNTLFHVRAIAIEGKIINSTLNVIFCIRKKDKSMNFLKLFRLWILGFLPLYRIIKSMRQWDSWVTLSHYSNLSIPPKWTIGTCPFINSENVHRGCCTFLSSSRFLRMVGGSR